MTPQETDSDLPVNVQEALAEAWVSGGLLKGWGHYVQLSYPYMATGKNIALIIWTFVGKVMSLFFNTLSRFFIALLPRSKCLLISWVQSTSAF